MGILTVNNRRSAQKLILYFSITIISVLPGNIVMRNMASYMQTLKKPSFMPPHWLFAPVWIFIYILMTISAYRICLLCKQHKSNAVPIFLYFFQLILNSLWPILFFGYKSIFWAMIDIFALIILSFITAVLFYRKDKTAGWLFLPYIFWLCFACVLNFSFYLLNSAF